MSTVLGENKQEFAYNDINNLPEQKIYYLKIHKI